MIPLTALLPIVGQVFDKIFPDKAKADEAKLRLLELEQQGQLAELTAGLQEMQAKADIVKTEAASEHWLTSAWRPITMLTFTALITARWFGWAAPDLAEAEYLALWDIVQLGLGGYVVGRSVEKVVPGIVGALKK